MTSTSPQIPAAAPESSVLSVRNLNVYYGAKHALKNINFDLHKHQVTALIGPSGCGKSTLIRCLNRMNDFVEGARVEGLIEYQGLNVNSPEVDEIALRSRIGMVFQKPNPFPKSVSENIAWGLRLHGRKASAAEVERILKAVFLWEEVKDKLKSSALSLSGGQQQRLCIARAMALEPEILLMDEPCSALDPIATAKIEELILSLKKSCTVAIVTHNLAQAKRISDETLFLYQGDLIEQGLSSQIFEHPKNEQTADYIHGRFG